MHLVNWDYDAGQDSVHAVENLQVSLDLESLGVSRVKEARYFAPGAEPVNLLVRESRLVVPKLELWGVLQLGN